VTEFAAQSLRMRRLVPLLPVLTLLFCSHAGTRASTARADAGEALRLDNVTDELALAQIADQAGDAVLAKAIAARGARGQGVVAARAAVHAAAPELLVPGLVELALSRDPALASEAAESLTAIFERLTPSELGKREVLLADLRTACEAFAKLSSAPAPRPDISAALTQAASRCQVLLKQS
jgi:hypothetical protein